MVSECLRLIGEIAFENDQVWDLCDLALANYQSICIGHDVGDSNVVKIKTCELLPLGLHKTNKRSLNRNAYGLNLLVSVGMVSSHLPADKSAYTYLTDVLTFSGKCKEGILGSSIIVEDIVGNIIASILGEGGIGQLSANNCWSLLADVIIDERTPDAKVCSLVESKLKECSKAFEESENS
jgi:hypothetical protein